MGRKWWNKLGVLLTIALMTTNTMLPASSVFANDSIDSSSVVTPSNTELTSEIQTESSNSSTQNSLNVTDQNVSEKESSITTEEQAQAPPVTPASEQAASSSIDSRTRVVETETTVTSETSAPSASSPTEEKKVEKASLLRAGEPVQYTDLITSLAIKSASNDQDITASTTGSFFRLLGHYDASKYGDALKEGDFFEVKIPAEIELTATTKPVVNPDNPNETFGTMTVVPDASGKGGILRIVFNKTVEGRLNVKGLFNIQATLDLTSVNVGETATIKIEDFEFKILRNAVTSDQIVENELLYKNGGSLPTKPYMFYNLRINRMARNLTGPVVISDEIDTSKTLVQYIPDSFILREVKFDSPDSANITSYKDLGRVDLSDKLVIAQDGMSFKITLTNVGTKSYILDYHTTTTGDNTEVRNTVRISENNIDLIPFTKIGNTIVTRNYHSISRNAVQLEGATGQGDLAGKIRVTKLDDLNKSIPIEGVKFTVTSQTDPTITHTIVTDAQGYAITPALPNGKYILKEVETKSWYILDGTEHVLTVDSAKPTLINVFNKRVETSYETKKVWNGGQEQDRPTVYFQLMSKEKGSTANPTPVANQRQEVAKTNATYTFNNLPKYTAQGIEIDYSVIEVDADGNNLVGTTYDNYAVTEGKDSYGAIITNTFVSPKTDFTVEKVWTGGPETRPEIQVQLFRNGQAFGNPVSMPNGTTSYTWTDLDAQDVDGVPYVYTVDEVAVPENYTKVVKDRTITNTYVSPKTEYTGKKNWVGGPVAKPDIQLQLFRDGVALGAPVTLPNGTLEYTWTNLDKTDANGKDYVYTVDEVAVPSDYTKTINGNTVVNKYVSPKTEVTVTKMWVGGPATKPEIQVQLFRDGQAFGNPVTLPSGTTSYTWTDLDQNDKDGKAYVYTVDEVATPSNYVKRNDGNTITNIYVPGVVSFTVTKKWVGGDSKNRPDVKFQLLQDGKVFGDPLTLAAGNTTLSWNSLPATSIDGKAYTYSVQELPTANYQSEAKDVTATSATFTNKYVSPKTDYTINKVWVGGPSDKPEIQVQLFRDGVALGNPVSLANGTTTYTWTDLDETDTDGKTYVYTADEVAVPENYTKAVQGDTITNTYVSAKTEVTVTKTWVGGPADKPEIQVQLFRDGVALGDLVTLPNGTTNHTWTDLDVTDADGKVYVYTVDEVAVPENYTKTLEKNTITNTYVSPKTEVTVDKTWVGGPADKPEIQVQLLRDGVALGDPVTIPNGTTNHTWTDLDVTDANGKVYVYTVDEVAVPENYTKTVEGTTITNKYVSPKTEVTVKKVWVNGPAEKPEIQVQLFRNGVALGAPVSLPNGTTNHTWTDLDVTDADGKTYEYTVDEVATPANYVKTLEGNTITNTYTPGVVSFTVTKEWVGGDATNRPEAKFQLLQDGKVFGDPLILTAGNTTLSWNSLPATSIEGKVYTYTVQELPLLNYQSEAKDLTATTVTFTNKYESPKTEVTMTKVWVDGPEEKPEIQVQLFRNGEAFGDPVTLANGTTSHTWKDLDATDAAGEVYDYTVDEVKVPENYTKTVEGTTITNKYVSPKTSVSMTKVWVNGPDNKPEIQVQLFRNGEALGDPVTLENGTLSHTWTDLDVTDAAGKAYDYTVDEVKVPTGYVKTISGMTITNTWQEIKPKPDDNNIPSKPVPPVKPGVKPTPTTNKPILPKTGTESTLLYTLVALAFVSLGGISLKKAQKK
ncbi:Cna B-type domain-containing protein [Granulicatella seriolae]|uniref:Cna B-type domain-containing protein n=1 Tax=Granulicatella seriolae TaxID=2967226 RepID=A0ABT1WNQ7_9LACT|nr:Cna B-type domain-containing protein [Granulicatella seriolae]